MTRTRRYLLLSVVAFGLLWVLIRSVNGILPPAVVVGAVDGKFSACPHRPNCISSQAVLREQRIDPITYQLPRREAQQALEVVLKSLDRGRIVDASDGYYHVEFRSLIFGFVDDAEFMIDESAQQIHFRSAARLGYYDLGVNRDRLEKIRNQFEDLTTHRSR